LGGFDLTERSLQNEFDTDTHHRHKNMVIWIEMPILTYDRY